MPVSAASLSRIKSMSLLTGIVMRLVLGSIKTVPPVTVRVAGAGIRVPAAGSTAQARPEEGRAMCSYLKAFNDVDKFINNGCCLLPVLVDGYAKW